MDDNKKIVDRVEKLIRLANSTTFDNERNTAAVEAVKLLHENKISIGKKQDNPKEIAPRRRSRAVRRPEPPQPPPPLTYYPTWIDVRAQSDETCSLCGQMIPEGVSCFTDGKGRFLCEGWPYCADP